MPSLPQPGTPARPQAAVNGSFWTNHSVAGGTLENSSQFYCDQYYPGYFCFPQAAAPSVLPLSNGQIGYAYELFTNATTSTCPLAQSNGTEVRVLFTLSKDGGSTFGTPLDVGNTTCPYYQALEPSFGVSSTGTIYGAFVEANATPDQMNCPSGCGPFWGQALWYTPRLDDALGFVESTDSGGSFHKAVTISKAGFANIADPSLATFGRTIYIAYMDLNNTTTSATLGGSNSAPVSAQLVYSADGGSTWNGPYVLPGYNATEYYDSMNPQVAVGPNGEVYVAYSSNRHCIAYCAYTSQEYGDDIYLASSGTNGTSWSSYLVAKDAGNAEELATTPDGVSFSNAAVTGPYIFEEGPAVTLAVAASTGNLYVAWTGALNESAHYYCGPPTFPFSWYCIYSSYSQSVLRVATSSDHGVSWTNTSVGPYEDYYQQGSPNGEFMPGIGVSPDGTVYLTYAEYNGTYTANGCYQEGSFGDIGFEGQWVASSTDGVNWSGPDLLAYNVNGQGGWWTTGWTSSVAFNATTGGPLIGYALTNPTTNLPYGPWGDYTWPGVVELAVPYAGPTTTLTLQSSGLPAGTVWKAWVMGETYISTAPNITIANAPMGRDLWVKTGLPPTYVGYGAAYLANLTLPVSNYGFNFQGGQRFLNLTGPGTFYLNYSLYYYLNLSMEPRSLEDGSLSFQIYDPADNFAQWMFYQNGAFGGGCAFPWLIPAGTQLHLTGYRGTGYLPSHELYFDDGGAASIGYFNGSGPGSFTGAGPNATITMNGPINETGWVATYGVYNISVQAPELPSGSTVHFSWDGTPYSFTAPGPLVLHNVSTGTYPIANIWATASAAGYEYFGFSQDGNPVAVPNHPVINLTFSYVEISAPSGVVSLRANGITPGTPWQFQINGTIYSSSTPWINVSTRPGTFAVTGYPIVSANGSASYAPLGLPPTLSVATEQTYLVNFSRAYQVTIAPALGGSVSPAGTAYWVAPGTALSFAAQVDPGYSFGGWSGKGAGSYTGPSRWANVTANGPVVETPSFYPLPANHFQLTFAETSLPAGTPWTVFLDGVGYTTNMSSLTVTNLYGCAAGSVGTYSVEIPYAYVNGTAPARYVPGVYAGTICGGSSTVTVPFFAQYLLSLEDTAGGSSTATPFGSQSSSSDSVWVASGDTVVLQATASSGYVFAGWNGTGVGSYSGTTNPEELAVVGAITEVAIFTTSLSGPPPVYSIDFHAATVLPSGLTWSVVLGSSTYLSTGPDLVVPGLPAGKYVVQVPTATTPDRLTEAVATNAPPSVTVEANVNVSLTFRLSYWLELSVSGSGTTSPTSGWQISGTTVEISASASAGQVFSGWSGTGKGAYSGTSPVSNVSMLGPIHEVATCVPSGLLAGTSTQGLWGSTYLLGGLGVAGLVIGLAAGAVAGRRYLRRANSRGALPDDPPQEGER